MTRQATPRATILLGGAVSLLLGGLGLAGCGDTTRPPEQTVFVEGGDPNRPVGQVEFDDAGRPIPPSPADTTRILVISGEDELDVHVGGTIELGVLLFDRHGDPVPGERIEFAIDDEDPGDTALSAARVITDDTGYASVDLSAGSEVRDLVVQAWGAETRVVEFLVHVVEMPAGMLDVGFEYAGPVALGTIETYVISDSAWCEDPYYLAPPEDIVLSAVAQSPDDRLEFGPLLAGTEVTIVARGRVADSGVLAAGGCFADVVVPDGETRRIAVPLFLQPLNPVGTYTVDNEFDFTDAIPGTLGDGIRALVRFFGDRNQEREIAGLLFDLVESFARDAAGAIGGLVVELVRDWVEDDLNDIINEYIDNDAPQWVRDFFTIGSDLVSVVSSMEVISSVRLSKSRADGTFDGSQNWIGLAFYWHLPCEGDPDPECARHAFTMDQIAAGAEGVNLVFGQFTGRVHSYDRGVIDPHTLDLQYGRLIMFVLNHVILPAIADGANNLRDALLNLANCPAFADGITGGRSHLRLGGINIVSRDRIQRWCETAMGLAGDAAAAIIGRLRVDTRLTLEGTLVFVEETDDLLADRLTEGVWRGVIRTSDDQGPPFDGTFEGARDAE